MGGLKGFKEGKQLSKADVARRKEAYNKKLEEYDHLSLEELKILYPTLRGSYKYACEMITMQKMNGAQEKLKELETNTPKTEAETISTGFTEEEEDEINESEKVSDSKIIK